MHKTKEKPGRFVKEKLKYMYNTSSSSRLENRALYPARDRRTSQRHGKAHKNLLVYDFLARCLFGVTCARFRSRAGDSFAALLGSRMLATVLKSPGTAINDRVMLNLVVVATRTCNTSKSTASP